MRALGSANHHNNNNNNHNVSSTITLPRTGNSDNVPDVAGVQDTIYLCNFRVSVDGEWLCLKELQDLEIKEGGNGSHIDDAGTIANFGIESGGGGELDVKCENKVEREWVNYYCRWLFI